MHGMFGTRSAVLSLSATALSLALSSTLASAALAAPSNDAASAPSSASHVRRTARITDADPSREDHDAKEASTTSTICHDKKAAVEIVAGDEKETLSLEKCDGEAIPGSVDKLSVLGRPHGMARPKEINSAPHAIEVAPGIHRLDARLALRLETMVDHFRKDGETTKIVLISGIKAKNAGSYHASGRALDFRIEGADDEAVASFCKTMPDTGCGFYPNAGFVHMDVRDPGAGHVAWIDISKPGEEPKYVTAWPLNEKKEEAKPSEAPKEVAKAEAPASREPAVKIEVATKCEAKPEPKAEAKAEKAEKLEAKAEKTEPKAESKPEAKESKEEKTADNRDASKLPNLPAAVTVAPAEEAPRTATTVTEDAPAPVKKAHKRHHRHHNEHTI
jgi:hypothetical protein